ncbi:MAG: hypothetical protein MUD11_02340 [Rhodobacteraceae bacterium]|jgi:hypothetical protein|nr:hypothetical protein [Paracoccaceae bacterium]
MLWGYDMNTHEINLAVLIGLAERVLEGRKAQGVHSVDLGTRELYHCIPDDVVYLPYEQPEGPFEMGSLSDDLNALGKLLVDPDRVVTAVDVSRLAHVLRAVAAAM